jgi:hypothetical protein
MARNLSARMFEMTCRVWYLGPACAIMAAISALCFMSTLLSSSWSISEGVTHAEAYGLRVVALGVV